MLERHTPLIGNIRLDLTGPTAERVFLAQAATPPHRFGSGR